VPQIVGQRGQAGLERGDFRAVWLFQYGAGAGGGLPAPPGRDWASRRRAALALAGGDQAFADQRIIDSAIAQRIEPPVGIGGGADGIGKRKVAGMERLVAGSPRQLPSSAKGRRAARGSPINIRA
jgi:hypothetical protein